MTPASALGAPERTSATDVRRLTDDAFRDAADADAGRRREIRHELVVLHRPLVEHLARRFRDRGEPLDDLVQVATIGLLKSIDRFDHRRGVEFATFATPTIVGEIKRHFRDRGWSVHVPRRLQEMRLSLAAATAELTQQLGRYPSVAEIAGRLRVDEDLVLEGLASANAYATVSLDAVLPCGHRHGGSIDALGEPDMALVNVDVRESLKPLLARLDARDRRILLLRFFAQMSQAQIAREIGTSQMQVSRLLARTLARLRAGLDEPPGPSATSRACDPSDRPFRRATP